MGILLISSTYFIQDYTLTNKKPAPDFVNVFPLIMLLLAVLLAMIKHTKKFACRTIRFTEMLGAGIITTFIGAFILAFYMFMYSAFNEETMKQLDEIGKSSFTSNQIKAAENIVSPSNILKSLGLGMASFGVVFFFGFISSFVFSMIVRTFHNMKLVEPDK